MSILERDNGAYSIQNARRMIRALSYSDRPLYSRRPFYLMKLLKSVSDIIEMCRGETCLALLPAHTPTGGSVIRPYSRVLSLFSDFV